MDTRPNDTAPFQIARIAPPIRSASWRRWSELSLSWEMCRAAPLRPCSPLRVSMGATGRRYEFKWDGVRAIAMIGDHRVRLYARSGAEITTAYPELAGLGATIPSGVLDG